MAGQGLVELSLENSKFRKKWKGYFIPARAGYFTEKVTVYRAVPP